MYMRLIYLIFITSLLSCSHLSPTTSAKREISSEENCYLTLQKFFQANKKSELEGNLEIKAMEKKLAADFPSLAMVLQDRDQFMKEMRSRFNKQKLITPENPHQFDFTELGLPALSVMSKGLIDQKVALEILIDEMEKGQVSKHHKIDDLKILFDIVSEVESEILGYKNAGKISYYETLRLSNHYARVAGYYHTISHDLRQKAMIGYDRYLEGFKPLPLEEEYKLYKEKRFFVFQEDRESGIKGYRKAQPLFENAILDKNELKIIVIPTGEYINRDFLNFMFSRHSIYIGGLAEVPIQADGFFRPAGDFWYHDLRHESAKFYEKYLYVTKNKIPYEKMDRLNHQNDVWMLELKKEMEKITDPDFREAVELTSFNFHHDSGYPMIPSVFKEQFNRFKVAAFYLSLKVGGEKPFKNPHKHLPEAEKFLRKFWEKRLDRENQLLKEISDLH